MKNRIFLKAAAVAAQMSLFPVMPGPVAANDLGPQAESPSELKMERAFACSKKLLASPQHLPDGSEYQIEEETVCTNDDGVCAWLTGTSIDDVWPAPSLWKVFNQSGHLLMYQFELPGAILARTRIEFTKTALSPDENLTVRYQFILPQAEGQNLPERARTLDFYRNVKSLDEATTFFTKSIFTIKDPNSDDKAVFDAEELDRKHAVARLLQFGNVAPCEIVAPL